MTSIMYNAPQSALSSWCAAASTDVNSLSFYFSSPKIRSRSPSRMCCRSLTLENANANPEGFTAEDSPSESAESRSRRLILLRHADSSWDDRSLQDHDRPLSSSGRADAVTVSHKLKNMGWVPELILSSDAVRTRETLSIMQNQVRCFLEAEIHFISSFYSIAALDGQTADHLQKIICEFSRDDIFTVIDYYYTAIDPLPLGPQGIKRAQVACYSCMGHNKGWEEAASMFTGASIKLQACNAALLESHGRSWEEAFALAGLGGWELLGLVKPNGSP